MATLNDKFNLAMAFKKGQQRDKKSDIRVEQKLRKITGTATSDSKDGKVMVRLGEGDAVETSTIASVKNGDTVSVIISNGIPTVQGSVGWGDSMQKQVDETKADVDDHEKLIADVKQDVADYKATATATYATKTEVDSKTGAITKTLTADYTKTVDLASTDAVKDAKSAGTTAQSQLSSYKTTNDAAVAAAKKSGDDAAAALTDYKGVVTETYAEKTDLTEAVNQLSSTMTSNYTAFTDYRKTNDTALSKAQSDATNAQSTIDTYKKSNDQAVADAKAAGTTAQNQLSAYKGTNDQAVADAKAAGTAAQSNLDSYKTATNQRLDELKNIADNAIESWYLEGAPTTSNPPASTWTTDALKKQHSGDMYVDTNTGYSYRWSGTAWVQIKDSDVTKALKEIETVKTTYATKSELSATDTELSGKIGDTLTTAKTYTDSSIETEVTNRNAAIQAKADSISLDVSKTYTKSDTFAAYQSDADSRIATANSNASTAKSTAATAASDAATAKTQSSTAVSTANTANSNAIKAVTTANTASSNASAAVSTANGAKTTANQAASTANSASSTANAAKSTVDGMQIGGRNLALNSAKLDIPAGKSNRYTSPYPAGSPIVSRADGLNEVRATSVFQGIGVFANALDLNAGDEVVFSAFAHALGADSELSFFAICYDASGTRVYKKIYIDDDAELADFKGLGTIETEGTRKIAVRIKWSDEAKSLIDGGGQIRLTFQVYSQVASGNYVSMYAPKLERGTKATDWTPAPEDVDSAVSDAKKAGTDAQTNLDDYKSTVAETYATKSSLKVQEDRITTEVAARKQTDTNLSALSTRVTQTETSVTTEISDRKQAVSAAQTAAVNSANANTADALKSYTTTEGMNSAISTAKSQAVSSANANTDAKLGSYTKTADLADTAAVKDAKKAGTDAQATADQAVTAASKATETANAANTTAGQAKTAAADAQETANTAKTNAAAAQSTANTAKANAATAQSTANGAANTANATATMIRQYAGGVLVAKTGAAVGALVNANGSFDVVTLTWANGVPSVSGTLSSFDADSADIGTSATPGAAVNLLGGAARFYVKQWDASDDGSREVRINASGNGSVIVIGPEDEATNGGLIIRSDSGIPKLITDDDPYPTDAAIVTQWPFDVQGGLSIGGKAVKWKSAAVTLNTSSSLLGSHSASCLINSGLGLAYLAIDMSFESPGWQPGTGTWLFRLPSGLRPSATKPKRLYNLIQIYIGGRWGAHVDVHSDGYCYPTWGWQATNIMCNLVFPTALLGEVLR